MLKLAVLLVASALIIEGSPSLARSLAEAAKNGNWEVFQDLLRQNTQNAWSSVLAANVEDLKPPNDKTHVYGHAVSTYKEWTNDNGNVSERSGGLEVLNRDGVVTKRVINP